jgi:succinate dehydrogenase/fumarate reductase cytochrome b subunit
MTARRRDYGEVRRLAAQRRAGHEWWTWYVFWEPMLKRLGPPLALLVALILVWVKVPHQVLGIVCAALAIATGLGWMAYQMSGAALQRRMNGAAPHGAGLGWAVAGVVTVLLGAAYTALWTPLG